MLKTEVEIDLNWTRGKRAMQTTGGTLRKSEESRGGQGGQGGQRNRASKGSSGAQKRSRHSRAKDDNLQRSQEKGQRRGPSRKRGPHNSKQKDRENTSANPILAKDKRDYFNEKRNEEYRVLYDDSDDEIPSWDSRVRAVKKRQAELKLQKRMDVTKKEQEEEEAKRKAYECDDDSDTDYDKGKRDPPGMWTRDNEHTQADSKDQEKALTNTQDDTNADSPDQKGCPHCPEKDETDEDEWFWDSGKTNITTRFKRKGDDNDVLSDEDAWFWDSIDSNSRWNRSSKNKSRQPGKKTRRKIPHRSLHAELQHKLESEQLQDYKTAFYENLRNQARSSTSSSRSSSTSSSDRDKGSQTSDDEERTRTIRHDRRGRKGVVNGLLDDSSSSTDRTARRKDRRHRWNASEDAKESSMTSESTSSINSEDNSSS